MVCWMWQTNDGYVHFCAGWKAWINHHIPKLSGKFSSHLTQLVSYWPEEAAWGNETPLRSCWGEHADLRKNSVSVSSVLQLLPPTRDDDRGMSCEINVFITPHITTSSFILWICNNCFIIRERKNVYLPAACRPAGVWILCPEIPGT